MLNYYLGSAWVRSQKYRPGHLDTRTDGFGDEMGQQAVQLVLGGASEGRACSGGSQDRELYQEQIRVEEVGDGWTGAERS